MDAVRHRFGTGLTWLRSHGSQLNSSALLDSWTAPFTESYFGGSSSGSPHQAGSELDGPQVVYLDANGRELSQQEVQEYSRATLNDSPWGFVASRYALALFIMAVVVNRITHICRPQGRPRSLSRIRRLSIQLPAIAFLAYSGLLLFFVTIHSFFPQASGVGNAATVLRLPQDLRMLISTTNPSEEDVHAANAALLWRLFLSVCFAVVSSTLVRTLEGNNVGVLAHPDDLSSSPTFNLVGFAVLLHLHASSYSFPPNKHVYLSILFQVGEVLGVQVCTCWISRPPISRLALTSFFGLISTVHFLIALRSGDQGYPFLQTFSRAPDVALIAIIILTLFLHALTAAITDTPLSFSRLIDPRSLPASTDDYSLALFKVGTACLSSTRLSGMDSDLIDIKTGTETWIEVDGAQVTVRNPDGQIADAMISVDGRGGLAREIRKIKTSRALRVGSETQTYHYFSSTRWREAGKFGTMLVKTIQALIAIAARKLVSLLPFDLPRIPVPTWVHQLPRRARLLWHGTNGEERRNQRILEARRRNEALRQRAESDRLFRERADATSRSTVAGHSGVPTATLPTNGLRHRTPSSSDLTTDARSMTSWQRFFAQDFAEEDEDDDWEEEGEDEDGDEDNGGVTRQFSPSAYWQSLGSGSLLAAASTSDDDNEEEDDDGDVESSEAVGDVSSELLSLARIDFDTEGEEQASYTNVLMAHLSRSSDGVLTRGGYQRLIGVQSQAEQEAQHLLQVIRQRRGPSSSTATAASIAMDGDGERERMRLCVICYIEERTIICWPCKCLALCEGCREAMATRPPSRAQQSMQVNTSPTHTCPTCRTPVVGYSRLYLP